MIKVLTRRVVDDPIFVASAGRTPALIGIWILGAYAFTAVLRNAPLGA
jgi:hypothetical protein